MKQPLLSILRDKNSTMAQFRSASQKLGLVLAQDVSHHIEQSEISIQAPLGKASGYRFKNDITLVPILRSGIALLPPFLTMFESANVGFIGLQRNETTAIAHLYYNKLPHIQESDDVILLDPTIATGGSAIDALTILKERGAQEEKIIFAAIIASKPGLKRIQEAFPQIKIIVPAVDDILNNKKFIVPGLGDFGDRFFGTEPPNY